jgi:hypothetical protein
MSDRDRIVVFGELLGVAPAGPSVQESTTRERDSRVRPAGRGAIGARYESGSLRVESKAWGKLPIKLNID